MTKTITRGKNKAAAKHATAQRKLASQKARAAEIATMQKSAPASAVVFSRSPSGIAKRKPAKAAPAPKQASAKRPAYAPVTRKMQPAAGTTKIEQAVKMFANTKSGYRPEAVQKATKMSRRLSAWDLKRLAKYHGYTLRIARDDAGKALYAFRLRAHAHGE